MKRGIHPDYHPVVFKDANNGDAVLTRSPFWTGARRHIDAAGQGDVPEHADWRFPEMCVSGLQLLHGTETCS